MSKKSDKDLIVALDVGTGKVAALVCTIEPDGGIEIVAIAARPA